jgi:hypothetical protein
MVDFHFLLKPQFNLVEALGLSLFFTWLLIASLRRQERIITKNPRNKEETLESIEYHTKKLGK